LRAGAWRAVIRNPRRTVRTVPAAPIPGAAPAAAAWVYNAAMRRHLIRIFCVSAWLLLLGAAVAFQFWGVVICSPHERLSLGPGGIILHNFSVGKWSFWHEFKHNWSAEYLYFVPNGNYGAGNHYLFLPWPFLLVTWGALTVIILFLTRRRRGPGGAFPVEVNLPQQTKATPP
jgi:hypothetical protein